MNLKEIEYIVTLAEEGKLARAAQRLFITDDMDTFADTLWNSLNADNKVSLFVRYIDIETGTYESKIINKNK